MGGIESVIIPEIPIGQIVSGQIVAKNVVFVPNRGGGYDQFRPPIASPEQQLPEYDDYPLRPLPQPDPLREEQLGNMIAPKDFKMPQRFPEGAMAVIMGDTFTATLDPYALPEALDKGYSLIGIFDAATADRIVDNFTKNPPPNPAASLERAIKDTAKLNIIGQIVGLAYADVFAKMNDNLLAAGGTSGIRESLKPEYMGMLQREYPTTASFAIEIMGAPDINELLAPVEKYLLDGFGQTLTFGVKNISEERAVNDWVKGQNAAAINAMDNYIMLTPMPETRGFGEVMNKPVQNMTPEEKVDLANQYMDLTNQFQHAVANDDVGAQEILIRKIDTINQQGGVPAGCVPADPTSLPPDLTPKGCQPKDSDKDGNPDITDPDDDNDGLPDPQDPDDDGDGQDDDGDGQDDGGDGEDDGGDDESGYDGGDSPRQGGGGTGGGSSKTGGGKGTTPPYDPNRDYWEERRQRWDAEERERDRKAKERWDAHWRSMRRGGGGSIHR